MLQGWGNCVFVVDMTEGEYCVLEKKNHTATTCFCFLVRGTGADWAAGSRVFGTV